MANLIKVVVSLDDGSTQEFDVTPAAPAAPTDPVVEVDTKTESGKEEVFTPATPTA